MKFNIFCFLMEVCATELKSWGTVCARPYSMYIWQVSPTPGPQTDSGPGPIRKRAAHQEVSSPLASEASSAASHHSHYCLNQHPPLPASAPGPWKDCLPRNRSLVPERLGTAAIGDFLHTHTLSFKCPCGVQVEAVFQNQSS